MFSCSMFHIRPGELKVPWETDAPGAAARGQLNDVQVSEAPKEAAHKADRSTI